MAFKDRDFRNSNYMRLKALEQHIATGRISPLFGGTRGGIGEVSPTPLQDAFLIELEKRGDDRGFFARCFCEREFHDAGLEKRFVQMTIP